MKDKEITWDTMPMLLLVKDLCEILHIGQAKAYESYLFRQKVDVQIFVLQLIIAVLIYDIISSFGI